MAELVEITSAATPRTYSITDRFVMGRGKESELHPALVETPEASRQHAIILRIDGQCYLEDLRSRRGTTLNGERISARHLLRDGDIVGIAEKTFRFQQEPPSMAMSASSTGAPPEDGPETEFLASVPVPMGPGLDGSPIALANAQPKLQAILGLLNQLGKSLAVDDVLNNLVESLLRVFPKADQALAGLLSGEGARLTAAATRSRHFSQGDVRVSRTLMHHVVRDKAAILSAHVDSDPRFGDSETLNGSKLSSLMCAPLLDAQGQVFGVIQLGRLGSTVNRRVFDEQDLEVLASVASQAGITLRYAREHANALQRQAMEQDLKLARQVQLGILPAGTPKLPPYEFFHYYEAAYEVGGDYYDYIPLPDGRLAVVVADVSGKGVAAALLMAKVAGELRYFLCSHPTIAAAVARMNDSLCNSDVGGRYVTMAVVVLDPAKHEATLVNAGHLNPLLRQPDGSVAPVVPKKRGAGVGLFPNRVYEETLISLKPGAALLLYTDGFSEAMNIRQELYGNERLTQQVSANGNAAEVGQSVVHDVHRFIGGQTQSDDMCMVCLSRLADPG